MGMPSSKGAECVPTAVAMPPPPAIPGYRPVALLGSGGMASVWMAARDDGSWCALKVTHSYVVDDDSVQGRFLREAEVASLLRHRNIAGVVRSGAVGRQLYLDMELVAGVSLSMLIEHLGADAPVPTGLIWRINDGVMRGLDYAHERVGRDGKPMGLVHRDLSPSNVLVGFDGVARIVDFGMVRACLGAFRTSFGTIGGTPRYMSPEQTRGRRVDRRSDVYAWAVVVAETLTGCRLVRPGSVPMMLRSVVNDVAPPLSSLGTDLPPALDGVFASMLEKEPSRRPISAGVAREAINAIVGRGMWTEDEVGALVRRVFADRLQIFERLKTASAAPPNAVTAPDSQAALHDAMTAPTVVSRVPVTEPMMPALSRPVRH